MTPPLVEKAMTSDPVAIPALFGPAVVVVVAGAQVSEEGHGSHGAHEGAVVVGVARRRHVLVVVDVVVTSSSSSCSSSSS